MPRVFKDPFIKATVPIPGVVKPYKYRKARPQAKENLQRITHKKEDENLSGFVHGKIASDLEERFARSLDKFDVEFTFEYSVDTAYTLPGEEKLVDFILWIPIPQPVELDGIFTHASASKIQADRIRDDQINEILEKSGFQPIIRITGVQIPLPTDQEISDQVVQGLI